MTHHPYSDPPQPQSFLNHRSHNYREIKQYLEETARTIELLSDSLIRIAPAYEEMLAQFTGNTMADSETASPINPRLINLQSKLLRLVKQVEHMADDLTESLAAIRGMIRCELGKTPNQYLQVELQTKLAQITWELEKLRRGRCVSERFLGQLSDLLT